MPAYPPEEPAPLAGGAAGPAALRPLLGTVLDALAEGAAERGGPLPAGGPPRVAEDLRARLGGTLLTEQGRGPQEALHTIVSALARGAADPAEPHCAAHLHCPPLALATAADTAASALNPSMDSWDQAPSASELEALACAEFAALVFGEGRGGRADALVTTGGTEANQLAALLARERAGPGVRLVCGANAHHSVARAAWLLGLAPPLTVPTPAGVLTSAALSSALARGRPEEPRLLVATAGTTDTGAIDALPEIASVAAEFGVPLHVDAAYGGPLLFSPRLRGLVAGLERADTVTFDLHKLGWQPVAAGLLAVRDARRLGSLSHRAEYLNAEDDTEAGLPDLLGRSLRTSRRPDVVKVAVTLRALGRSGLAALVERVCDAAREFAELIDDAPEFELRSLPVLSTVLFRPRGADAEKVTLVRRRLLAEGRAVLGRARLEDGTWLKATLLNPHVQHSDFAALLKLVHDAVPEGSNS
ncbi:pyridoxal phosphate-dependent decarboxylase family protein [Streptomyces sulphureus]|uniref:pyridoxal phosphate-dependent decarboxylase family protein n=1 Tax=Streptomyces sulphureus TaxID=47758 RepID=UPI00036508E9|nr:aminotransferase class V-fold PLP-dependent enzyme [Streptomyces sulphureus]